MYGGIIRNHIQYRGNHFLEYAAQAAGAGLVLKRYFRNLPEHFRVDAQLDALIPEYFPKLIVNGVFGFGQNPDQHLPAQVLETGDDGQPSGEFRNQSILEQVGWFYARVQPVQNILIVIVGGGDKPVAMGLGHDLLDADKRPSAYE